LDDLDILPDDRLQNVAGKSEFSGIEAAKIPTIVRQRSNVNALFRAYSPADLLGKFVKTTPAFFLLLIALATVPGARAATATIGPEASLSLPSSALYHLELGNQPDDNSVQDLNPPVFSWLYYENPALYLNQNNNAVRYFHLQLSTSPSFNPLVWDIACSNNFYNFLAPITNNDGSTYTSPVYWRVVYLDATGNLMSNGAPHSFSLSPNAKKWDRRMLADENYLISVGSQHPHLFFNSGNRDAVSRYLQTHTWQTPGVYWSSTTNEAYAVTTNSWWNSDSITNAYDWWQYSGYFAKVGFTYQLTTNAAMVAADPGKMLEIYATNLVKYGWDRVEAYNLNASVPQYLAMSYDWLYPLMTAQERANVLHCMESMAQYYVYEDWLYTGTAPNVNRIYTNTLAIKGGSQFREGESHSRNDQVGLALTMAGMGESAILRSLHNYFLGYYYAQFDPFQGDDGRAYNTVQNFQVNRQFGPLLMASESFPEWGLTNAPIYADMANIFAYLEPVGYGHDSEIEPDCWGVQGGAPGTYLGQWQFTRFYDVACFLNNGALMRQYNRTTAFTRIATEEPLLEIFTPFYFPPPAEANAPSTTFLDQVRGWAMSASAPPTDWGGYTNGVGFIMAARPSAAGRLNGTYIDGQVEMWAYGAHVTSGGSGNYEEHPMFQNNPLFVDGISYNNPNPAVSDPWYARFTAFTNTQDYTFVSADLTKAFARTNWNTPGYQNILQTFYSQATNARPYIANVDRSVLFVHKRYFVIYDQMQTTQPAHFQWKWNVWRPTVSMNAANCSFSYTCTNSYNGSNVTVYVAHVVNPALMSVTNMTTGANLFGNDPANTAKINPFTGENYNLPSWDRYYPDHYWPYWANSIWIQNVTPATNWHFMTVVFPVKWGQAAPVITRVDDNTVQVQQGGDNDTIQFTPGVPTPTVTLNLSGPTLGPVFIPPVQGVHISP